MVRKVDRCPITLEDIQTLAKNYPHLNNLELYECDITDEKIEVIVKHLRNMQILDLGV